MTIRHRIASGLNAALASFDAALVRRSEVEPLLAQRHWLGQPSHVCAPLPDGADAYLTPDNPRLRELRERYRKAGGLATAHSVWADTLLRSELDLRYFRGDNPYVWQHRGFDSTKEFDLVHLATAYYVKTIDELGLLGKLGEDGAFGAHTVRVDEGWTVSRDLLDSIIELNFLERTLGISRLRNINTLDIGGGYGRLVHRIAESLPGVRTAFCVDGVAESTFLSEYYLRYRGVSDRARVVPFDEIEATLDVNPIHLVTNVHSFSECTFEAISWWLDLVRRHEIRFFFLVPNGGRDGGETLVSREIDERSLDFRAAIESRGYRQIARAPKFADPGLQQLGLFPTQHYLFELRG